MGSGRYGNALNNEAVMNTVHRALFLLLADLLAGPKWFLINNFTSLIDFLFGADYDYLSSYQDVRFTVTGIGFVFAWWMVHFLNTRQMWFNGVALELFLLVQVLGYLSNHAFTTHNAYIPLAIAGALHILLGHYRHYLGQIRILDPEQSVYSVSQLQRPFVPRRALQLIQITPFLYALMVRLQPHIDETTYVRVKYSLGMADALVYVGINMDMGLVVLSRLVGTIRTALREFSVQNIAWMVRVNVTGSHTVMIRDFGWRSVPSDQLHSAWCIYWLLKVALISVAWGNVDPVDRDTYWHFMAQELSGSFVAATATVYFCCLLTGTMLTSFAALFACSGDAIPKSNVLHGSFDTVQLIRWSCFPWKLNPAQHVRLTINAVMLGHIPLCGKMIQIVGHTARRTCACSVQKWLHAIGGVIAMLGYFLYSYLVTYYLNINAPSVSQCFADTISHTSGVWLFYNLLITLMEITITCVFQGLDSATSRQNLEKGTVLFRTTMTGVLAVSLTLVNLWALNEALFVLHESCGYKDVAHNCLQIAARIAFAVITVRN
ncbi:hypothetical protein BV898_14574 [Hypsibius exemplaris]|uniref:Uncharacterized protein n=1 Tax=Hypsibius exemplaris TaxID=2072580 RepID=A0A9X6RJF8_HYPEX|nr:hypothetical protein BV898_14574 [Hypsibius exemplaris]